MKLIKIFLAIVVGFMSTVIIASPEGQSGVQCNLVQGIYTLCNFTDRHMQLRMSMDEGAHYQISCKFASDDENQTVLVWTNTQKFKLTDGESTVTHSAPNFGFQNTYLSPGHKSGVLIADLWSTSHNANSSVSCTYIPIS